MEKRNFNKVIFTSGGDIVYKPNLQKKNKSKGDAGELLVHYLLMSMGFKMIEKVHTPWKPVWIGSGKTRRLVSVHPEEKVSGDWRAVGPRGVSVLVEVKSHDGDRLVYSFLERHQHESLTNHHLFGGKSYIAWVRSGLVKIFKYPRYDYVATKSIKWDEI